MVRWLLTALSWSQRRFILWLVGVLMMAAVLLYLKRGDVAGYKVRYENRNRLRAEVERLRADARHLEREREDLAKDGFAAEKAARERFRLSRPDEMVVYLETPAASPPSTSTLSTAPRRK